MDIVVHGTKGGCHIFTPKKLSGLFDAGAGEGVAALGQQAYAISFKDNNTIFSRYEIIKDVRGDKRTGFVAYSLFLPNNKKLSGIDIRNLLDRVSDEYRKEGYIDDNNNLKDERENWAFLDRISNEYQTKLSTVSSDNAETLQSGAKDAAYIYYDDIEVLQKYFDERDQVEYSPFKLVFFVESDLRGTPADPLNALRHSENDLTGKIDLENPKYNLLFNTITKGGVRIEVKVNGSTLSNKNKIKRKSELEITWSKQYYIAVPQQGKCFEIDPKYIVLDNDEKTITIKEIDLEPEEKTITFEIKDRKGNPVTDTEIQIGPLPWNKIRHPIAKLPFEGEDIGKYWTVLVKKSDSLFSDTVTFSPENQVGSLILYLKERKKVEIIATNDEGIVIDFTVMISGKVINSNTTEIEFIDDEIDKTWNIEISKNDKSGFFSGKVQFCPNDGNKVYIPLKKSTYSQPTQKLYSNDAGEHGTKSPKYPGYSASGNGNDLSAQYKKKESSFNNPKVIAGLIVGAIVLGLGILMFISLTKSPPIEEFQIQQYVEGDALLLEQLTSYKTNWEKQKPGVSEEGGGILSLLSGSKKQTDSKEKREWNKVLKSIDDAKNKRELVEAAKFAELKKLPYSDKQKKFKNAVDKIDSVRYPDVRNQLGDVSKLTLNQIADKINTILIQKVTTKVPNEEQRAEPQDNHIRSNPTKNSQTGLRAATKPASPSPSTTSESSSSLQSEFWKLVNSGIETKESYDDLFKKSGWDQTYKTFYNNYLNNNLSRNGKKGFDKFIKIPKSERNKAKELKGLEYLMKQIP